MKKLNLRLLRNIQHSKGQYLSIIAVVITGLFVYVAMNNVASNLAMSLDDYYEYANFADLYVDVMGISERQVQKLIDGKDVLDADGRIVMDVPMITDGDQKATVRLVTVDTSNNRINKLYINDGSRVIERNEILVIEQFAEIRGLNVGDKIQLQINGFKKTFIISGIVSSPEFTYLVENEQALIPNKGNFGVAFIEETYLSSIVSTNTQYNDICIELNESANVKDVENNLESSLEKNGINRITRLEDQLSNTILSDEIEQLKVISESIPYVFLSVAGAILVAMMSRTVKNDRVSIGILKALGYTNYQIVIHYAKIAVMIGLTGGVIGSFLGTITSGYITSLYSDYFNIPMIRVEYLNLAMIVSIIMSALFSIISGLIGARKTLGIEPAEAMRSEPPKKGNRILLERFQFFWKKAGFTWKIVLRNIFREKWRFFLISLGSGFTLSLMIMTFWMNTMFNTLFTYHYGEFLGMDHTVVFDKFVSEKVVNEVYKLIDAEMIEGKLEFPFELKSGKNSEVVNIIGLEEETIFYSLKDSEGNKLNIPEQGILLSSNLANDLSVGVGDAIVVHNYLPDSEDIDIRVSGIVEQNLGRNGYMSLAYMNKTLVDGDAINAVIVGSEHSIVDELDDVKNISVIQSTDDMRMAFLEFIDMIIIAAIGCMIFSGILGFVIIYTMTIMSISERKMEFSSLRVLGFDKREIFGIILRENFIVSIFGVFYGIPLGGFLVEGVADTFNSDLFTVDRALTIEQVVYGLVFTFICLVSAQLVTYQRIRQLNFIEALKSRTT